MKKVKKVLSTKDTVLDIPDIKNEFKRIYELSMDLNVKDDWEEIKEWLSRSEMSMSEYRDSLKSAPNMIRKATALKNLAKNEKELYILQCRDRIQLWRDESINYWEARKANGLKKQITEAMIEDRIIEKYNENYIKIKENEIKLEKIVDTFKTLEQTTIDKQINLRKLIGSEKINFGSETELDYFK